MSDGTDYSMSWGLDWDKIDGGDITKGLFDPNLTEPLGSLKTNSGNSFLGLDKDMWSGIGKGVSGIAGLAQAWAGLQSVGIARDQLGLSKDAFAFNQMQAERNYSDMHSQAARESGQPAHTNQQAPNNNVPLPNPNNQRGDYSSLSNWRFS